MRRARRSTPPSAASHGSPDSPADDVTGHDSWEHRRCGRCAASVMNLNNADRTPWHVGVQIDARSVTQLM
jgi:hypothetical protein